MKLLVVVLLCVAVAVHSETVEQTSETDESLNDLFEPNVEDSDDGQSVFNELVRDKRQYGGYGGGRGGFGGGYGGGGFGRGGYGRGGYGGGYGGGRGFGGGGYGRGGYGGGFGGFGGFGR